MKGDKKSEFVIGGLISVIVPIYRVENYLDQCIRSIINQTYRDLEIILIDDGSDDNCGEICDYYARIDSRIKVIHKQNEGLNKARKSGIEISTGEYIGYVDGDDWIEPDMYEILIERAIKNDVAVVEAGVIDFDSKKEKKRYPFLKEGVYKNEDFKNIVEPIILYTGNFYESGVMPYVWNKLFKREAVLKYQLMDDKIQELLNVNLVTYPAIINTKSLFVEHKCLYHYRLNNNSLKHVVNRERDLILRSAYKGYKQRLNNIFHVSNADYQIQCCCMYHFLCRIPYIFDNVQSNKYLVPFGEIDVKSRVVLYGAGMVGIHLYHYITERRDTNLVSWVDKNYQVIDESYNVCSPESVRTIDFDYIIIAIMRQNVVKEVFENLMEMGIERKKILWIQDKYLKDPSKLLSAVVTLNRE